jgi:signal peptidase I
MRLTERHADIVAAAAPALLADVLRRFGRVRLRATGTSMLPAITPGDVLLIEQCPFDALQPGDIVLFANRRRIFIHRLMETQRSARGSFFVTRGDSNWRRDPRAHESQLLGRVSAVARGNSTCHVSLRPTALSRATGLMASEWIRVVTHARALVGR